MGPQVILPRGACLVPPPAAPTNARCSPCPPPPQVDKEVLCQGLGLLQVPSGLPRDIEALNLSGNQLRSILASPLGFYTAIRHLDLSTNEIDHLTATYLLLQAKKTRGKPVRLRLPSFSCRQVSAIPFTNSKVNVRTFFVNTYCSSHVPALLMGGYTIAKVNFAGVKIQRQDIL